MLKTKVNINMKHCMSHYTHKSIPDAKFEAGSSSSFGDMTSQNFPRRKRISAIYPGKTGFNFKRMNLFVSRIVLLNRKCQFQQFQAEERFFIFKIFGMFR